MKKSIVLLVAIVFVAITATAQRFAFVDTDYILENIPEYKAAQKELDDLSVRWQNQIEAKYAEIDRLYKAYQAEQILLTEDMKRKREDEIIQKEKEAKDYQKSRFGVDGELFTKRKELVEPIQNDIYNAVKELATTSNYAVIFDKASQSNILFADSKYNKSDQILKKLGYSAGKE
ncbi:MAG: hypothetical protein COA57_11855 [Flavobacteriales bacterium]|nr:MAG: hypothetical protein COA57_11855 [Flavobacteriales bacterium]